MHTGHLHHNKNLAKYSSLKKLYWSRFSLSLAGGLVSIFIPIFLLENGLDFREVVLFYIVFALANILVAPLAFKFLRHAGTNVSMFASGMVQVLVYVLLASLNLSSNLLWVIPIMMAVANELYWPAFHASFSAAEDTKESGKQVSMITLVNGLAQASTPLIGGLVAVSFGIGFLLLPAALIIFVGALPLMLHNNIHHEQKPKLKDINRETVKTDMASFFGSGTLNVTEQVVWPVLIFMVLGSLAQIGALTSLSLVGGVTVAMYVGRGISKKGTKSYMDLSSRLVTTSSLLRILANGLMTISSLNIFSGVTNSLTGTAHTTAFYRNASGPTRLSYLLSSELFHLSGWLLVLFSMYIASYFVSTKVSLYIGLAIAALGGILIRRIRHSEMS